MLRAMPQSREEHFWKSRARRVCLEHNAAIWLAGWLPVCLAAAVAATIAILLLRRQDARLEPVWFSLAVVLAAGAVGSAWARRREFFKVSDGLVRLEATLRLNNRLTAAAAGVGAWPQPSPAAGGHWRWRVGRVIAQLAGAAALVYLATAIPLPGAAAPVPGPLAPLAAWTEVETWIDALKKDDLVQPDSLENLREQLEALRRQDPDSWYDHASLEAGDNLHAETERAIRELQQNLQSAADQASKLLASSDQRMSDRELQTMSQELAGALQNMASGRLPLNPELLKKLQQMDPKALKSMSPEQLARLQQQLQQSSGTCKQCLGEGQDAEMMSLQQGRPGDKTRTGKGGPGGGGGPAPLTAKDATELHSTSTDTVSNDDVSRALPGEVVALSAGEHKTDKNAAPSTSGGQITAPGQGGQAAWKDSLTPQERETIAKFFQ